MVIRLICFPLDEFKRSTILAIRSQHFIVEIVGLCTMLIVSSLGRLVRPGYDNKLHTRPE